MAKKYSSLQNLARGSGTPYGKLDSTSKTNNPATFNVPYLKKDSPTFKEKDGKNISNYVPASALAAAAGAYCGPKHTLITAGEYVQGSWSRGVHAADAFRDSHKFPSAIYISKYVGDGQLNVAAFYQSIISVEDNGGSYTDASGNTQTYNITPTLLTGSNVNHMATDTEPFVLVYRGGELTPYAGIRKIKVTWGDNTVKEFDVIIPGWKNNIGLGQSLSQSALYAPGNVNSNSVYRCNVGLYDYNDSLVGAKAHSHNGVNINNGATPLFVGYGGLGTDHGLFNLNVTRIGQHHDNSGLWSEGFQPDDNLNVGSSFATNSHQETWPQGLFYSLPTDESEMFIFTTAYPSVSSSIRNMWDAQYAGSNLTNLNHPTVKIGNALSADSAQHYEVIQGYLLNQAVVASNRNWDTQAENSQAEYANGNTSGSTNTADDGGSWFSQIETEMMSAVGSVWNNGSLGYNTHQGGEFNGFIGDPSNTAATPSFQHIQIYSKDLSCACGAAPPSGGPIPIDLCNDPNSLSYWQYVGTDCNGSAIPSDLWNGTASLGNFGCTSCDYEIITTTCTIGCDCVANSSSPVISTTHSTPTTLGSNDGVLNIEVAGGVGAFVYFIEPLGNTSAGLGVGAVEDYTQTAIGGNALTANGIWTYTYDSGSAAGTNLKVEVVVDAYNTSPIITLNKFIQRGSGYIGGEQNVLLENVLGGTITVTINTVAGVVVSPYSLNEGVRHYEFTDQACAVTAVALGRKVTLGTNVFLEQEQAVGVNNYGSYLANIGQTNLAQFPPQIEPYKYPDFFKSYAFPDSDGNNTPITGIESGDYKITVFEGNFPCDNGTLKESLGCFSQTIITIPPGVNNNNGCTDNTGGTNDGVALNYDAAFNTDDGSCIYCRAVDGKLVDNTSTELSVSGSTNPGDILTSTNNSIAVASTDSTATDGSISYSRSLNSIMNYYAGLIIDGNGTPNAEFKMELYSRSSSAQTLTGASLVGAPVVNTNSQGFNKDFDSTSWTQGLTYGYYAIKSYVNDPDSASEQEDCFQVDYFIVPVLACIIGQSGMQVGITLDNVTITDLDLVVASIPGNNLNPCTLQCCDAPIVTNYLVQTSPSCGTPAFNITQSCPNGVEQYITNTLHDVEFSSDNGVTWSSVSSNSVANFLNHSYTINIYNAYGPGDYRVTVTRTFTWANGTTSQCIDSSNSVLLESDICGCTDPTALNFDPLAVIDDGSCTYCVDGCMDPTAINYNSLATCDDGSCMGCVYGCMDPAATNYNAFATCDDGSCNYGVGCGCTDILASNFGYDCAGNAVGFPPTCDDGCCEYGGAFCANPPSIDNIFTIEATCLPDCDTNNVFGCTDPTAFDYNSMATIDDGTCCFIAGCMDPTASNYNSNACYSDNSCIPYVYGCTDPTACNYDPLATIDDGSCEWTSCVGPCIGTTTIPDNGFEAYLENTPCQNSSNNNLGYNMGDGTVGNNTVLNQNICKCTNMYEIPRADCDKRGGFGGNLTGCITDHLEGISAFPKLRNFVMSYGFIGSNGQTVDFSSNLLLQKLVLSWQEVHALNLTGLTALSQLMLAGQGFDVTFSNPPHSSTGTLLTSLDLSTNTALTFFEAGDNNALSSVTLPSTSTLEYIELNWGNLTSLDVTNNTGLEILKATAQGDTYVTGWRSTTGLSSINLTNNINLERLELGANKLTSIDLSTNVKLKICILTTNQLTSLDVTNNPDLVNLQIKYNSISSIDLSNNTNLRYFWARGNNLTTLDFTGLDKLVQIIAPNNSITSVSGLGLSNLCTTIKEINMANNNITGTLDLKGMGDGVTPTPAGAATLEIDLRNNDITVLDLGENWPIPTWGGSTSGQYCCPWNSLKLQGNNNLVSVKVGTAARVLEAQAIAAISTSTWSAYNFIP